MRVSIYPTGESVVCGAGSNLLETLIEAGVFVDNPCNGKGICGKCKVKILSGAAPQSQANGVPVMSDSERFLTADEINAGIRLACFTEITGDMTVETVARDRRHRILTGGYMPDFIRDRRENGYGVVVDIGTTTVAAALIDLKTGAELSGASMINAQKIYGQDVLTRITYEYENPDTGAERLQKAITSAINGMIGELCQDAGADREEINEIVVAANCTMLHMLLGADARSLGKAPYKPLFVKSRTLNAGDIGIRAGGETPLYCLPSVSAYIGADIVAGVCVCELQKQDGNVLFIDIGTNGEIVLANRGRLLCCSCAAGPALEGMNISSGMRAAEGAVEDVKITPDGVELTTIGDAPPAGLCGSGILAAVRELLRTGIIKKQGAFIKQERLSAGDYRRKYLRANGTKREFVLSEDPKIMITQGDVRQVQLAKGAILSGFTALLGKAEISMSDLDKVMIAGQFGAHLPVSSIVGTGILPAELGDRIAYVGNSSKTGAYMALTSKRARAEMEALAERMEYLELAETENYERIFAECMIFPEAAYCDFRREE
jgi:uncharacterized 2Fe-2S/4Fe-4S cluster protein (DUF4445 family)